MAWPTIVVTSDRHSSSRHAPRAGPASIILFVTAALTTGMALPAMIALRRTDSTWPLRWLRNAALVFTFLNALVDFATEGFGALLNLTIGLFTLAILSYQLDRAVIRSALPASAPSGATR